MEGVSGLIAMGGYGAYVWPAYLATAVVMGGLVIESRRRIARNEALLAELELLRSAGGGAMQSESSNETPEGNNET